MVMAHERRGLACPQGDQIGPTLRDGSGTQWS
jgi:hypothetical protein